MDAMLTIAVGLAYVVLAIIVLVLSKFAKDVATPYRLDEQLTARDNPALGPVIAGYFAGVVIVFLGAAIGPDLERVTGMALLTDLGIVLVYALLGIAALNLGRWVVDRLVLFQFSTAKEIIQDRNVGTGAVECGCFLATALIVAGAIHGEEGGLISAIVFFLLGQGVLVLYGRLYQRMTAYDVHAEIERDSVAAGVALAFHMVAIGIIVLKAASGGVTDWADKLTWFAGYVVLGAALLIALRKITDALFLPGTTIAHEIAQDKNLNAAWMEGIVSVGVAAVIFFVV